MRNEWSNDLRQAINEVATPPPPAPVPPPQVTAKAGWSVRRLAKEAEDRVRKEHGLSLAVALVLCPARDSAIPFYEPLANFVGSGVRGVAVTLGWLCLFRSFRLASTLRNPVRAVNPALPLWRQTTLILSMFVP